MTDRSRPRAGTEAAPGPPGPNPGAQPVEVGTIVRPWGRRGDVIVHMDTPEAENLLRADRARMRGTDRPVTIETARRHAPSRAVVHVKGVDSIEQAETLRGARLFVPREGIPPAPAGSHYAMDLLGAEVRTLDGTLVGRVKAIRETGGPDLLVVENGSRETLVPFVKAICRRVDAAGGRIEIDPPEGLLDLNDV